MFKRLLFIFGIIISLSISSSLAFSTCKTMPDYIQIYSGSNNLGKFSDASSVYIKSDLTAYPLKLEFFIENDEDACYPLSNNFQFKLFSTGATASANSIITNPSGTGTFITKATFNFDVAINVVSSFLSTYTIQNTYSSFGSGSLQFLPDGSAPVFLQFLIPTVPIIKSGEQFKVEYYVQDEGSGLELISITGGTSQIINFESNNKTYRGTYIDNPTTSRTYTFNAQDKLGFSTSKQVNLTVDSIGPNFSNLRKIYTYDGIRKISFNIDVEDTSFGILTNFDPIVRADLTQINPLGGVVTGNCVKMTATKFDCAFNNIPIALGDTSNVLIRFSSSDAIGNYDEEVLTEEIFVDKDGPVVSEFYLENSLGVKNKLGSNDEGAKIILKFTDKSIATSTIDIIEDFRPIQFPVRNCVLNGLIAECVYNLGTSASVFDNYESNSVLFKVRLQDMYGNQRTEQLDIAIDNVNPVINSKEIIETESIKDGIVKSGERINFRIKVTDENLFSGQYFIYGDFSEIDFRSGMDNVAATCSLYNSSTVQCDFNNIVAENGYMDRQVHFRVSDSAGNNITESMQVEIFKVSNEVVSSYDIQDLYILNPLNRNMMKSRGGSAWFEGSLKTKDNNMIIVNYLLQGCSEQNLDPLLVTEFGMYPDETVVNRGQDNVEDFALYFDLKNHPNLDDLNNKIMTCTMAVLKRDATQIYAPELVEFSLTFSFFDVPDGNLLKRHAQNILSMTQEVAWAEGWFDSLYQIYHVLYQLCNAVTTGGGVLNSASNIYENIRLLAIEPAAFNTCTTLATTAQSSPAPAGVCPPSGVPLPGNSLKTPGLIPCLTPFPAGMQACKISLLDGPETGAKSLEKSKDGIMGMLDDVMGPVKLACDWVTCRNGATILGLIGNGFDGIGYDDNGNSLTSNDEVIGGTIDKVTGDNSILNIIDWKNKIGETMCTIGAEK